MSRQRFGGWGAELDERAFANALAALGALRRWPPREDDRIDIEERSARRTTCSWELWWPWLHPFADGGERLPPAAALARSWTASVEATPRVCIEVHGAYDYFDTLEPSWLTGILAQAEHVTAVHFASRRSSKAGVAWDWPLDVGFLDDAAGRGLREAVRDQYWRRFVDFVDATRATAQVDVLLFPGTLAQALRACLERPHLTEIHTVLALGGAAGTRDVIASLEALRAETGAAAAGVVSVDTPKAREWLDKLLFELAHDHALDEAVFAASAAFGSSRARPILVAEHGALREARTSVAAKRVGRLLARSAPSRTVEGVASAKLMDGLGIEASAPLTELSSSLDERADSLEWSREGEAATEIVALARHAREGAPERRPARFVQGRLFRADPRDGGEHVVKEALVPGERHRLDVRIGLPSEDWVQAPALLPEDRLPPQRDGHMLTIMFVAPGVLEQPETAQLWLPAKGDSAACAFHFVAPERADGIDARVVVLHRNRILQTLRVRVAIGRRVDGVEPFRIDLETVLRSSLDDLEGSAGFDVALFLNDNAGTRGLSAFAGQHAVFVRLHSLDEHIKFLRNELEKITKSPQSYATMRSKATTELVVTLARSGHQFATALRELGLREVVPPPGTSKRRLQVVSIHADDFVPLEFAYDRTFPNEKAKLCPKWKQALDAGECQPACPADLAEHVCPLGFWGLSHVIERRLHDEAAAAEIRKEGADCAVGPEAGKHRSSLGPLRNVLWGAADKAENFDPTQFARTKSEIETALRAEGVGMLSASEWKTWAAHVGTSAPEVLLLMPHTEASLGASTLEIGVDRIAAAQIDERHVSSPPPPPPKPGPIVILLGCRTAANEVPFSNFVGAFRRANASVVVATISTVRGRDMAPVAQHALALLLARAKGSATTVGDIVLELRRKVLRGGAPIALTLVAYGDIDWQLGGDR